MRKMTFFLILLFCLCIATGTFGKDDKTKLLLSQELSKMGIVLTAAVACNSITGDVALAYFHYPLLPDHSSGGDLYVVLFRKLNDGSYETGSRIRIARDHFTCMYPDIVFNQDEKIYLLVWNGKKTIDDNYCVFATKIDSDGKPVGEIRELGDTLGDYRPVKIGYLPAYAKESGSYLLMWPRLDDKMKDPRQPGIFVTSLNADLDSKNESVLLKKLKYSESGYFPLPLLEEILVLNNKTFFVSYRVGGGDENAFIATVGNKGNIFSGKNINYRRAYYRQISSVIISDNLFLVSGLEYYGELEFGVYSQKCNLTWNFKQRLFFKQHKLMQKERIYKSKYLRFDNGNINLVYVTEDLRNMFKMKLSESKFGNIQSIKKEQAIIGRNNIVKFEARETDSLDAVAIPGTNKAIIALSVRQNPYNPETKKYSIKRKLFVYLHDFSEGN